MPREIHGEQYYALKELAEMTGLSVRRLQQLVRGWTYINARTGEQTWYDPEVPAVKMGREFLVEESELSKLLNRRKPGGWRGGPRERRGL